MSPERTRTAARGPAESGRAGSGPAGLDPVDHAVDPVSAPATDPALGPALAPSVAPLLTELAPVLRRAVTLDPAAVARLRLAPDAVAVLVRLPFGVLVSRTVLTSCGPSAEVDVTVSARDTLDWLAGARPTPPAAKDLDWRGGTPPASGWVRVDVVPDHVVRDLVRTGALALKDAAVREGVPGAQPRAEVADALLDSVVLTVSDDAGHRVELTLRTISALTRMGFLPRGGGAAVDLAGRWTRVAGGYGSVLVERPGEGLRLR